MRKHRWKKKLNTRHRPWKSSITKSSTNLRHIENRIVKTMSAIVEHRFCKQHCYRHYIASFFFLQFFFIMRSKSSTTQFSIVLFTCLLTWKRNTWHTIISDPFFILLNKRKYFLSSFLSSFLSISKKVFLFCCG